MGQIASASAILPQGDAKASRGFALLSPHFLDELRSRITLSAVVNRTLTLKKAGNEFKACCPFHNEKTPSFWVNDQKGFYHCFGCSAHGDVIRWMTDNRGLAFMDAVKELAAEAGMELPKPDKREIERLDRAAGQHELLESAAKYFERLLASDAAASVAREYLNARGITDQSITDFRLGFAPEGRSNLQKVLTGFNEESLVESGLLIQVDGKAPYDRFRNRLMIPIRNSGGRIVGFGGRIIGNGEPKYLNSPDTFLFDKGRTLYNLDRAAPASRKAGRILVVEGYFDVIGLDHAGIREVVAPMGTALTEHQLEHLWRLADEPVLCFDGDAAGRKAAERASVKAMQFVRPGKQLKIALLPAGQDPDDIIRGSGRDYFEKILEKARPLASFLYETEVARIDSDRPEQRAALKQKLEEIARSCADRFVADEFSQSFKEMFYEQFGWSAKHRDRILKSAVQTSLRVAPDLARLFVRSALFGLTKFPQVAANHLEDLAAIQITHPALRRWRDAIMDAVVERPDLADDGLSQLLDANILPEMLSFDVQHDVRFSFLMEATVAERASKQLEKLVVFLARHHILEEELREQDEQARSATDEAHYLSIELIRQGLREARAVLLERSAEWDADFVNV